MAFNPMNWDKMGGVLGPGPMGKAAAQGGMLGEFFDPEEQRRRQINSAMIAAGASLLGSSGPQPVGSGFGQALGKAFTDAHNATGKSRDDYQSEAQRAFQMKQSTNAYDQQMTQDKAFDDLMKSAPKDLRDYAKADREGALAIYRKRFEPADPIKELEAQKLNLQLDAMRRKAENGGSDNEYGLNPVWAMGPDGKYRLYQPSKDGSPPYEIPFPSGMEPQPPTTMQNLGTTVAPFSSKGGQQTAPGTPIDILNREAQAEIGAAQGKATAAAQGDIAAADMALDLVNQLKVSPNRERGTGGTSIFNAIPGTAGRDYQNLVDQAKSGAFLTAIQQMRGLGSLSNAEGQAATAAVTRMDTATSEPAFLAALSDYEKIVRLGRERAYSRLGGAPEPTGSLEDALQKYGN